jgi:hypothetical protein
MSKITKKLSAGQDALADQVCCQILWWQVSKTELLYIHYVTLASPGEMISRVSIVATCRTAVGAWHGPAAGTKFKELDQFSLLALPRFKKINQFKSTFSSAPKLWPGTDRRPVPDSREFIVPNNTLRNSTNR